MRQAVFVWRNSDDIVVRDIGHVDHCISVAYDLVRNMMLDGNRHAYMLEEYVDDMVGQLYTLEQGHGLINYILGYVDMLGSDEICWGSGIYEVE